MNHWKLVMLRPGFYSVSHGSNAAVRQFAVPLSNAARHVAHGSTPEAEIYPHANMGDLTPMRVVVIDNSSEIQDLERQAVEVQGRLNKAGLLTAPTAA